MSVIGSNILAGASSQGGYTIEESLRFNESQSSYLSRTDGAATSAQIFTFSAWVKRGTITSATQQAIFGGGNGTDNYDSRLVFGSDDDLAIIDVNAGVVTTLRKTTAVYRDVSAWYHIVMAFDTTQATGADRLKLYVNGVEVTSFSTSNNPALNLNLRFNSAAGGNKTIGRKTASGVQYFDGYLTEVNLIDGQALTPSDFGEYNAITGVWQPVGYTGTYGNNGFYLPMKLDNTTEGFNTVTYIGNDSKQKISGVGFSPDLVWLKTRNIARDHYIYDSVRGTTVSLTSNNTAADLASGGEFDSFDTDGFTVKFNSGLGRTNYAGREYVAWCWDAGDTTVSNTDGSITSSVRASTDYGFSVVTYTGNGTSGATIGHGLGGVAPSLVIVKERNSTGNWITYHKYAAATAENGYLSLNETIAFTTNLASWNNTAPTGSVFTLGNGADVNASGINHVAYCFSEIAGYSKFGSYTGTGASGNAVTTGFKPAFVMIKSSNNVTNWMMYDATRDGTSLATKYLTANTSGAEGTLAPSVEFTSTGFTVNYNASPLNSSGDTYIYMAFKDTREYAFWLDDSGNNNDWQPNGGITTGSTVTDTPTPYADGGNYAVLNPLAFSGTSQATLSKSNLLATSNTSSASRASSSILFSSGKFYAEVTATGVAGTISSFGIAVPINDGAADTTLGQYRATGSTSGLTGSPTFSTFTTGDVIGIAVNADSGEVAFYKNNIQQGTGFYAYTAATDKMAIRVYITAGTGLSFDANFGQRPFSYTPPTGFKSLHTGNLPDSAIENGSEYFNPVLYQGNNGASLAVTGAGFQPDLVWIKNRSTSNNHNLVDSVRGVNLTLFSNTTDDEDTSTERVTSIDADGFTVGTNNGVNANDTYVSWLWKAGGAAVTNTAGSSTSQVSASPTAGFSVVTYTGTGTSGATIGHGLGVAPAMIICKNRILAGTHWETYHQALGNTGGLRLNSTTATITSSGLWNNTSPTSTVFTVGGGSGVNRDAEDIVAYCFSEVSGYSKFGSYTGNGSADGPFVYLGFRPKFLLVKASTVTSTWRLVDTSRSPDNVANDSLAPNESSAELVNNTAIEWDLLSNGFKCRDTYVDLNQSGQTYIYMAFAENPFKNSLAR